MTTFVITALVGAALMYVGFNKLKKGPGLAGVRDGFQLIVSDGNNHILQKGYWTPEGNITSEGVEYPGSLCRRLSVSRGQADTEAYIIAVQPLALADHRTLEQARRSIVLGSLFKPSSDLLQMLQYVALAAVLAAAFFVYSKTSEITELYANQVVEVQKLSGDYAKIVERLSQPIQVQPGGAAPVPTPAPSAPVSPAPTAP